jgi:hypothetical protein
MNNECIARVRGVEQFKLMKIILTPIDFSNGTARVVDEAAKLAEAVGGTIALLHVARVPQVATDFAMESATIAELPGHDCAGPEKRRGVSPARST